MIRGIHSAVALQRNDPRRNNSPRNNSPRNYSRANHSGANSRTGCFAVFARITHRKRALPCAEPTRLEKAGIRRRAPKNERERTQGEESAPGRKPRRSNETEGTQGEGGERKGRKPRPDKRSETNARLEKRSASKKKFQVERRKTKKAYGASNNI